MLPALAANGVVIAKLGKLILPIALWLCLCWWIVKLYHALLRANILINRKSAIASVCCVDFSKHFAKKKNYRYVP